MRPHAPPLRRGPLRPSSRKNSEDNNIPVAGRITEAVWEYSQRHHLSPMRALHYMGIRVDDEYEVRERVGSVELSEITPPVKTPMEAATKVTVTAKEILVDTKAALEIATLSLPEQKDPNSVLTVDVSRFRCIVLGGD